MPDPLSRHLCSLLRELETPIRTIRSEELDPVISGRPPNEATAILENEILRFTNLRFQPALAFVSGLLPPLRELDGERRVGALLDLAALLVALDANDMNDVLLTLSEAGA